MPQLDIQTFFYSFMMVMFTITSMTMINIKFMNFFSFFNLILSKSQKSINMKNFVPYKKNINMKSIMSQNEL